MKKFIKNIAILGDGGWGTTLAVCLANKNYHVTLWGAFPEYCREISASRENLKFLPGIKIPQDVIISGDLETAVNGCDLIVLAIPSQFCANVIRRLKPFDLSKKIVLSVIKGIEEKTLVRVSQIIKKELGRVRLAVLSGPTIAREVALGIPSTAVIASGDIKIAKSLQAVFHSETFRIYTSTDIAGVELGGSIKNVIAIACGVCDGLGFGTNTKAAILSRGLAEMTRLATAMGAKSKTLFGLSGLGDLVTTCFNEKSRNRSVGEALGSGKTIQEITGATDMIAEGVTTVKAIYALSKRYKAAMPITTEVYNIIYKNKAPIQAVKDLMNRALKAE